MFNEKIDTELLFTVLKDKPLSELRKMWSSANRKRASGQSILGGSYMEDETFLWNLRQLMGEKEAEEDKAPRTDDQHFNDQMERLRREHPGVSAKVARNYLERQRESKRDPLDVMRKNRLPAPNPEPAEPKPSAKDKWQERWGQ